MSTIQEEIQSLSPSAIIEMFVLDTTLLEGGGIYRFHAGTNNLQSPVTWQGLEYLPLPIEAEGFDMTAAGTLPRPKIRVANVEGLFSAMVSSMEDLVGCKIIRKRTMARFMDAVNFKAGNPEADPSQHFPDQMWFIDQKTSENKHLIEWELASAFDLQGVMLPFRQVIQNACCWKYRGPECGYSEEVYFDKNDQRTWNKAEDFCAKRLSSCEVRFVRQVMGDIVVNEGILPYGGFPGVQRDV